MQIENRHYSSTDLPTLMQSTDRESDIALLKMIYAEANANYRNLADIRFKLLGFVPAVSIIAWAALFDNVAVDTIPKAFIGLALSILGIRIAYGVRIYDLRNDELYDDIISRGRKLEEELGIHTAIYKGRPNAGKKDKIFKKLINHRRGLAMIYSSVFTGWAFLVLWFAFNLGLLLLENF